MIDIATTTSSSTAVTNNNKRKTLAHLENLPPSSSSSSTSSSSSFRIQLLSPHATLPTKGSVNSAGWDLYSAMVDDVVIPPHGRALIALDLAMACPPNTYVRIAPRSGLAVKHGIQVGAGVVDADYRGPVSVLLFNHDAHNEFVVHKGDRIAQCILECIYFNNKNGGNDIMVQVDILEDTERGSGGFGSTGVSSKTTLSSSSREEKRIKEDVDEAESIPTATSSSVTSSDDDEEGDDKN